MPKQSQVKNLPGIPDYKDRTLTNKLSHICSRQYARESCVKWKTGMK